MPLVLTNLNSGKKSPSANRPKAVIVSNVDPRLVALLAPFDSAWVVVPTLHDANVFINQLRLEQPKRLSFGDQLALNQKQYFVDECTSTSPDPGEAVIWGHTVLEVTARFQDQSRHYTGCGPFRIGTAKDCEILLPKESGLEDHHAVFARLEDRWFMFVVSKLGATQVGDPTPGWSVAVTPGRSIWLGSVELTATFEELDALDRVSFPSLAHVKAPQTSAETMNALSEGEISTPAKMSKHDYYVPVLDPRDPLFLAVHNLCRKLRSVHEAVPKHSLPQNLMLAPLSQDVKKVAGSVEVIHRLAFELDSDPWSPTGLFAIASYLWRIGFMSHSRWILKQMHLQNPTDTVVCESIAIICWSQAQVMEAPPAERIDNLDRSVRYFSKVLLYRMGDQRLQELHNQAQQELFALKAEYPNTTLMRSR